MVKSYTHSIDVKDVTMEFPGVKALDHVCFSMRSGEIRAVIGANGAGKSTLMNVLAGGLPKYDGSITMDGQAVRLSSPVVSKKFGIALVSQEVDAGILPNLSVAENIMFDSLVNEMGKRVAVNWKQMKKSAQNALERLNQKIDVNVLAGSLSLAQKQMVLIARAISQSCRFLILDEPTSALSISETEQLFQVIRDLVAGEDMGVIFISHRLNELFEICGHITVMRNGCIVAERDIENLTIDDVVADMMGDALREPFVRQQGKLGDVLLEVKDLCDTEGAVNHVSIYARAGEVVGISGLVGAGKTELAKCMFGDRPKGSGEIRISGKAVTVSSPHRAVKYGLGLVPEERRKEGVFVEKSVKENLSTVILSDLTKFSFINRSKEKKNAQDLVDKLLIKTPSIDQTVAYLSGGNQQKVVIGKWLCSDCEIYLMDEPTKGVDVGAKQEIYRLIQQLADQGKCVIYLSSETAEILSVTDRVYVLYNGAVAAEMPTKEATEESILYYATGGETK